MKNIWVVGNVVIGLLFFVIFLVFGTCLWSGGVRFGAF